VRTIEEALALKCRMPDAVLGGERHGNLIPGFDIGNSPAEYVALAGCRIISTTTNGTVALRACEHAGRVLIGALLNLSALVAELRARMPEELLLVCAGTFADFALEDAYAAGVLIAEFAEATLTDSAEAALAVGARFSDSQAALRRAQNGRALAGAGRDADVEWCAQRSRYKVVGAMDSAVIRPLPQ
jgi:2-phosphosulfolactate phosphatase